jgi:hypothetical protein
MNLSTLEKKITIDQTCGIEVFKNIPIKDKVSVLRFLQVVENYNKMKRIEYENKERNIKKASKTVLGKSQDANTR